MLFNISSIDLFRIGLILVVLPFVWMFVHSVRVGLTKMFGSPRIIMAKVVGVAWEEVEEGREESVILRPATKE